MREDLVNLIPDERRWPLRTRPQRSWDPISNTRKRRLRQHIAPPSLRTDTSSKRCANCLRAPLQLPGDAPRGAPGAERLQAHAAAVPTESARADRRHDARRREDDRSARRAPRHARRLRVGARVRRRCCCNAAAATVLPNCPPASVCGATTPRRWPRAQRTFTAQQAHLQRNLIFVQQQAEAPRAAALPDAQPRGGASLHAAASDGGASGSGVTQRTSALGRSVSSGAKGAWSSTSTVREASVDLALDGANLAKKGAQAVGGAVGKGWSAARARLAMQRL